MEKIKELQKLKELWDKEIISNAEFNKLKQKILSNKTNRIEEDSLNLDRGFINIHFAGKWFLFDAKVKIIINDKMNSKHSIKKGFNQKIKFTSNKLKLKIVLGALKSTTFMIDGLDFNESYSLELEYDETWGKFSDNYNLSENS